MLFFLHIPKTAGSTLNYIIKNNFSDRAQEIRWHWTTWIAKGELQQKLKHLDVNSKQLVHGHFVFGVHELSSSLEVKYLTFVRDPLKKAISGYHHVSRDAKAMYHSDYKAGRLEDYLLDNRVLENDNGLVRRISGVGDEIPFGKIQEQHYDKAIENINKWFIAVGITEQFDLSIELFKSLGVFQKVYYWRQNTTKNKVAGKGDLSDAALKKFREANGFDYALYNYCLDKFNQSTANISFSQSGFDFRNKVYNMFLLVIFTFIPINLNVKTCCIRIK